MNFNIDFSNSWVDKTIPTISISECLNSLEKPFDSKGVAEKTYNKHFNNPESQYYHKSVDEIIEMWQAKGAESCHYGSLLDDYIETILTGNENDQRLYKLENAYDYDERLRGLCDSFDNFYKLMAKSGDVEFIAREKTLYIPIKVKNPFFDPNINNEEFLNYYIKGRFDALFYNKRTNKWIIIDWKSSGSIDKVATKWTEKFLGPMFKWPALNYYRYTNQLHFYKKALLERYLPEGTNENDVVVMIVNLPGKIIEESGKNYMTHLAGMTYDSNLMNDIFNFAIVKKLLESGNNKEEENKKEDIIQETSDDVENLF